MFESRMSAGATENYQGGKNLTQRRLRGPVTWKDMLKNALRDIANWRTKRQGSEIKSQLPPWMTITSRRRNWYQLEDQIVLKCLYLARVGRPDILWSVNKLGQSVTKWTGACDKRFARMISHTHHTSDYRQHCHVGNMAQRCRLGLFQDSDFAGDLEDSKLTSGGILCIFGSRTFVPTVLQNQKSFRWMLDWEWMDYLLLFCGMW